MAKLFTVHGKAPTFGKECRLSPTSVITGDVQTGDKCSFWFGCVVRGDVCTIKLGDSVNVQDGVILHGTYQKHDLTIGNRVSIGHRATVHGCTVEDDVLIGMGATLMDGVHVEPRVLIAAGAVVTQHTRCESGYIYAGIPAKPIKKLSDEAFAQEVGRIAKAYPMYASWYEGWTVT